MCLKTKLILALLAVSTMPACGDPNVAGEPAAYINADLGFRLDYPSNWDASVDPLNLVGAQPDRVHAVAFVSQPGQTAFIVFVQQLDGEEALADFSARQVAGMRSTAGDASYSGLAPTQIGGVDALTTQTTVEQDGQALTQRVVLAVKGRRGYAISLTAPANSPLRATLDDMLASFVFLP